MNVDRFKWIIELFTIIWGKCILIFCGCERIRLNYECSLYLCLNSTKFFYFKKRTTWCNLLTCKSYNHLNINKNVYFKEKHCCSSSSSIYLISQVYTVICSRDAAKGNGILYVNLWTFNAFVAMLTDSFSPYFCATSRSLQRSFSFAGLIEFTNRKPNIRVFSSTLDPSAISKVSLLINLYIFCILALEIFFFLCGFMPFFFSMLCFWSVSVEYTILR